MKVRLPSYRLHKASGQAVVTLSGRDHYLGEHGTKASRAAYERLIKIWEANGRRALDRAKGDMTVNELLLAYWRHAEVYYVKNGEPTSQIHIIKQALRPLKLLYGESPISEFGPLALKAVRQQFISRGVSRGVINGHIDRIRLVFQWGVEEELLPESIHSALKAVRSLAKGRTSAPDHPPIGPVTDEMVEAVLPHLRPNVRAMVELQVLTGMRPGEVSALRACDIDRSGDVWVYSVSAEVNKTEHHEKARSVYIGPNAQAILKPWIAKYPEGYLFRPSGWNPRPATRKTKRVVFDHYSQHSYWQAIQIGCQKAFPHPTLAKIKRPQLTPEQVEELKEWYAVRRFHPNQLRHTAATRIRKKFDLDAARTILGHTDLKTSEIYAERDSGRAIEVARMIG